ncbi:bifunctional (p)ppGpp synthetase/guanosine-3',5'-bis(diphosphate) 3'-pyrophosphohydrolase [Metabacillus litoralis]|uniref:Bifunctional (P)ppGpp synthetase/guanosine-3',5'-bis(Diphosphate) 3'-pyrophosphohydrolase n=1 Tax=Metabacillus litoralis TaxID=152268 RepID=A0A5C6W3H3_9BACI|nr:HD domain-containing protein [Metabacillus litoralis]TXC91463.1 bifunctional (p)ppGpp synthetase/guanosine-3',5'-bis(diphosphate) 3'-pyrophosphohydrolase [Metabacillus litoralis]
MDLLEYARNFAKIAHADQVRKISSEPYYVHVDSVANTLKKAGFSREVVIAGYLHDVIEDTNVTEQEILQLFGKDVLQYVLDNTENKNLSWEERKQETINKAKTLSLESKALIAADKLDNSEDLLIYYQRYGEKVWKHFNRGHNQQLWYYNEIVNSIFYGVPKDQVPEFFNTLKKNVEDLFGHYAK